jgi:hypothetical protein
MDRKRRASRSATITVSLSDSLKSLSENVKAIVKSKHKTTKKFKKDVEDLENLFGNMNMGDDKMLIPVTTTQTTRRKGRKIAKTKKTVDLVDLLSTMNLTEKPKRTRTHKMDVDPVQATRMSTRRIEALPEIEFTLKSQKLTDFLGDMKSVVRKLHDYEARMKLLDQLLTKILKANTPDQMKKLSQTIYDSGLDTTIDYLKHEEKSIIHFKDRIAFIMPHFEKYREGAIKRLEDADIPKTRKEKSKKNLEQLDLMMEKYIKSYEEKLLPLAKDVLEKIKEFQHIKKDQKTADLFATLGL